MRQTALALLLACGLAVTGCTAMPGASPSQPSPSQPSPSQPGDESTPALSACSDEVAAAAFDVVRSQQQAFAKADFAAARRLASQGFRSGVNVREFADIIRGGYAFLLEDPSLTLVECRMDDTTAMLRIDVAADEPVTLAYRLVIESAGWRIDGASTLKEVTT